MKKWKKRNGGLYWPKRTYNPLPSASWYCAHAVQAGHSSRCSTLKPCWMRWTNPPSSVPSTLFLSMSMHSIDDGTVLCRMPCAATVMSYDVSGRKLPFHCECNKPSASPTFPLRCSEAASDSLNSINYVLKGICPDCAARVSQEA